MDAKDIQKGFNSGYILRTQAPDLAQRFAQVLRDREDGYAVGFVAGIKEREKELFKTRGKNYDIGKTSLNQKSRTRDRDKDMGDRDL